MGIREWPGMCVSRGTAQRGEYEEKCAAGALRYVLEGEGVVSTEDGDEVEVGPNSLIEVIDESILVWTVAENFNEMIILTPEYKGPSLAIVAALLATVSFALVALTGM